MSRKRPFEAIVCLWRGCASAVFETEEELFQHVEDVHTCAKGPCCWEDCAYVGKTKQKLKKHTRTHTGAKPYECEVCKMAFTTSCSLARHKLTHTGVKPYACTECKMAFTTSSALTTHMRTHTGLKPYACMECKMVFRTSSSLARHKLTHTGEKPHECEVCKKTFADPSALTKHMRIHTGEKPHECEVCKKAFAWSSNLTKHMLTHTGEKPYECEVCKKTFAESGTLTIHMRTHTGEKPHECEVCKKTFAQSGHLTSHRLRQHVGPWCTVCNECYVPEENMICGRCNIGQRFGVKEKTFFEFIYAFDERLAEVCFTLRDQAMGCGVRKRPDGLMQLQTKAACVSINSAMETLLVEEDYRVKLIIEADEHQHAAYSPSCELVRLQQIQERDGDALYVLRYNVDQPGGLEEEKLSAFCRRLLEVLDGDFLNAVEAPTLFEIEYFGYTEARRALLAEEMRKQLESI